MKLLRLVHISVLSWTVATSQIPLGTSPSLKWFGDESIDGGFGVAADPHEENSYKLKWPVKKVAIVGAGPGALIAYRELSAAGFDVHLFERDNIPGGNWHYTDEVAVDAPIPNVDVSIGDFVPDLPPAGATFPYEEVYEDTEDDLAYKERKRVHRGPKPLWKNLHSNAAAPIQQISEWPWPKDAPWELPHQHLQRYIRSFASWHRINSNDENPNTHYNTRVELVEKYHDHTGEEAGWRIVTKEYVRVGPTKSKATWREEIFDAVVVSTGRWNAPNIPNSISGVKEWSERFPGRIIHSRQYRFPEVFQNETVLVVGAATSGGEISRDVNPYAKKVYQSIRPDKATVPHFGLKLFLGRLPANTTIIPEIKEVRAVGSTFQEGEVVLNNGTVITGIDRVIFATGYRYSFPFLPAYHNSSYGLKEDAPRTPEVVQPIVTDGTHLRSLHLDLFYIPDPTLAFLNMNVGMQTFTYGEYLSVALAKVWAGKAHLPKPETLWKVYDQKVKDRGGYGPYFLFLGAERTNALVRYFLGWLNDAAYKYGGRQLDQLPVGVDNIQDIWMKARFNVNSNAVLNSLGISNSSDSYSVWGLDVEEDHPDQLVDFDWY
ncbi:FAD/NAD(P)-binding domain-containing protein [Pluteus cervinus]|uniref:FAD/NAD(P)-binding domain-containing protein n=1 Tax=Pluteus cervinus TaxID=181527 RepID=A0ACD3AZ49_9AGAR|nr:FAD/NAD(P)-binding domain-containing protein [Pluteus cervinus]